MNVRDNSKHTVCNSCWEEEFAKKTAGKPKVESDIQELDQISLGKCFQCHKDVFLKATTVKDKKFHPDCFRCLTCKNVINPSDGYAQEGDGALCEKCC